MAKREEHIKIYSITLIITFVLSIGGYFIYHSFYNKTQLSKGENNSETHSDEMSAEEKNKINDLINENNQLKEQLSEKEKQFQQEIEKLSQDEMNQYKERIAENMDKFMEAQKHFYAGQYVQCAEYLETIDANLLGEKSRNLYQQMAGTAFAKAGEQLYFDGSNEFKKGNYQNAINKLKKAHDYQKTQYFSDDALYFLAYAYYKSGEYVQAKETALKLLQDYPDTTYRDAVNILISNMNNQQ